MRRETMFYAPLDRTYQKKDASFRDPLLVDDSVLVVVAMRRFRSTYQMELRRRGPGRWLVSYFDGQFGPVTSWLCEAQTSN
jgi:hypothetical protein